MEGMQNNNQQMGSKLTPQQQYMMAQRQAYMQRIRQQYLYQQQIMQRQQFTKQAMQSPQQFVNQLNNRSLNPIQQTELGFVNQPSNNSPEINLYNRFNQNLQKQQSQINQQNQTDQQKQQTQINQNDFARKDQVKIQWKFDEGAKQVAPLNQEQPQSQIQIQSTEQMQPQAVVQQPIQQPQTAEQDKIITEEDELKGLQIEYEGETIDLEHMSLEETKQFRERLLRDKEEVMAKLNLILARDPNLNPVRLEDFPYYATLKRFQKGV